MLQTQTREWAQWIYNKDRPNGLFFALSKGICIWIFYKKNIFLILVKSLVFCRILWYNKIKMEEKCMKNNHLSTPKTSQGGGGVK